MKFIDSKHNLSERNAAFTLLEVMVAVAILSIAMTAIFSSQAGAIRAGARARQISTASLLARCKMAEVEESMAREGFAISEEHGEDDCCEGGELPGFSCEWSVERVELPDSIADEEGEGGLAGLLGGGDSDDDSESSTGPDANSSMLDSALTGAAGGDAIGEFAIQFAFPVIRPMIEEQVRRAMVTVSWGEGTSSRSFSVVQYLVADQGSSQ